MSKDMRGLTQFITGLRAAESPDDEKARIQKELANIRAKFNTSLNDYDKKKYVWKLVYIYLLGYPVDIGHMVAIGMVGSKNTSVKTVGYIACSVLFTEKNELLRLVIQSIKADLASRNDINQSLALAFIGCIGNREFAEALTADLTKVLFSGTTRPIIRKKAVLALLRLFRKNPDAVPQEEEFDRRAIALLEDGNIGVLIAVCSLLLALASIKTKGYEDAVPRAIVILHKVVFADPRNRSVYKYYNTICPWLQVKILKLLQYFPAQCANISTESWRATPEQQQHTQRLFHTLNEIITRTTMTKNPNKNNGDHAILFDVSNLVIHMARTAQNSSVFQALLERESKIEGSPVAAQYEALQKMVHSLSVTMVRFLSNPEPNYRYLGLDCMVKLSFLHNAIPTLREQLSTVLTTLKDPDVTLRKRGLDVLYAICDKSNVEEIVKEMIAVLYVENNYAIKTNIILKILVLAEKFNPSLEWYLDITFEIICSTQVNNTGDSVQDSGEMNTSILSTNNDIWYRVIQMVTNNESLHQYAAIKAYQFIKQNAELRVILPLNGTKLLVYILGEFSCKAFDENNNSLVDPFVLFNAIQTQFKLCNDVYTKSIILCSYAKLAFTLIEMKPLIENVFNQCSTSLNEELQQRAIEFNKLLFTGNVDMSTLEAILDVMPPYDTKTELESRLAKASASAADRDIWTQPEPDIITSIEYDEEERLMTGEATLEQPSEGIGYAEQPQQMLMSLRLPVVEIFKSNLLNITVKINPQGSSAQMILVVANKADYEISNIQLSLPQNHDVIRVQSKPTYLQSIAAGQQDRFLLLWQTLRPFETPPPSKISFSYFDKNLYNEYMNNAPPQEQQQPKPQPKKDEFDLLGIFDSSPAAPEPQQAEKSQHDFAVEHATQFVSIPLRFPIFSTTFVTPNTSLQAAGFLPRWKELGNQTVAKLQSQSAKLTTAASIKETAEKLLRMHVVVGCDQDPNNLYLHGTFNAARRDSKEPLLVDVMVRIETKPNSNIIRATVNSGSTSLSAAVMKSLQLMLLAKVIE